MKVNTLKSERYLKQNQVLVNIKHMCHKTMNQHLQPEQSSRGLIQGENKTKQLHTQYIIVYTHSWKNKF